MDSFVIERILRLAEELLPVLPHVEEPVVLAHHHPDGGLHALQDLRAEVELLFRPKLGEITAEEDEVGLWRERVHVINGLQDPGKGERSDR